MRRLTIVGTLPPNVGIADTCIEQVRHLSNRFNIEFLDFRKLYPEKIHSGKVREEGVVYDPPARTTIRRLLTWYNPFTWIWAGLTFNGQVLHIHWWTYILFPPVFTIVLFAKFRRKPIVASVHNILGHESNLVDRTLSRLLFSQCNTLVVHSRENKKSLMSIYEIPSENIRVIPLGIPDFLVQNVPKSCAAAHLEIPDGRVVILLFGNIREYKGVDCLIRAVAKVRKSCPNVHLLIAGKPWVSAEPYKNLIKDLNLVENSTLNFDFIPTKHLPQYFSAADILVLPYTHFNAQSGPGRIAIGYSLPMIVTNVGGLPELVSNCEDCIAIPGNVDDLTEKLLQLILNPKRRLELSQQAKQIATQFSWSAAATRLQDLYIDELLRIAKD